ncbi:MAG: hypothetical protein ACE5HO_19475 [bacterium]
MKRELTSSQKKRFQLLLMKAVDNEMSRDELHEFERFLNTYDECKREGQQLKKLKAVIQDMKFRTPPDKVWDKFRTNVRHRL